MIEFGQYENGTEATIAEFGKCDICVGGYINHDKKAVALVVSNIGKSVPIGSKLPEFMQRSVSDLDNPIVFEFLNDESIDVVINALLELKEILKEEGCKNE